MSGRTLNAAVGASAPGASSTSLRRGATICAVGAGGLAAAGWAAWSGGWWAWLAFGEGRVPMAPSTALLMVLLSVGAVLRARAVTSRGGRIVETACALLGVAGSGLVIAQSLLGFTLPLEGWLSSTSAKVGPIPIGRMSPVTAGCFLLASASLLCGRVRSTRLQPLRSLGGWFSLAVLAITGIIVAGYGAGTPLLYGGSTVPMALLTGLAFILLSGALLLGNGREAWPLRMFLRLPAPGTERFPYDVEWSLLVLLVVAAGGIATIGLRYLNQQQATARATAHNDLKGVADLKVRQIVNWRQERLGDANLILRTPFPAKRAQEWFADQAREEARVELAAWLEALRESYHYQRVLLLDSRAELRLASPPTEPSLTPGLRQMARRVLEGRQVVFSDFHGDDLHEPIQLDLIVPLLRGEGPSAGAPEPKTAGNNSGASPVGVVVLTVDPREFLYPLIQAWPTPSPSAETLLVRREGNEVLFLNELRHRKGTAMKLRRGVDEARLPAAMGVRGERGIREGEDYRGVPVVVAVRAVPDTAWLMVAKVDQMELYAPLRRQAYSVGALTLTLLMGVGLGVTVLWRRRNEHFLQAQLAAEHSRRMLAERFEHLMRSANDAILLADEENHILEFNERTLTLYGCTAEELRALTLPELRPEEARGDFARRAEALAATGGAVFETRHLRKDGTVFPVEVSSRLVEIGGRRYKLGILRDITQRKAHEAEIGRLNRLYATLSQVNQTIVRCQSREELFAEICRVAIEFGRFEAAWIGWRPADSGRLVEAAHCVSSSSRLTTIPGWRGGCGVIAEAMRTGAVCVAREAQSHPHTACCQEAMALAGIRSCVAFPLRLGGAVCGALSLCCLDPDYLGDEELRLLEEVASDVSFALDKLDKEAGRARAEEALRRSESALIEAQRLARIGNWMADDASGQVVWSAEMFRLYGRDPALGPANLKQVARYFTPESWSRLSAAKAEALRSGTTYECDGEVVRSDGTHRWIVSRGEAMRDAEGHITGLRGTTQDITERKQAESALQESEQRLREAQRMAQLGFWRWDVETGRVEWSEEVFKIFRLDPKTFTPRIDSILALSPWPEDHERDRELIQRAARSREKGTYDQRFLRPDGSVGHYHSTFQGCYDDAGRLTTIVGTVLDITERKRLEQERAAMEAQLRQQQKLEAIGTLASGVAHEINNPITGIMNYAQIIQDRLPSESPLAEFTGEIMHETQRVAGIVRNLLTFARNEKQSHSPARMADIIAGTLSLIRTVILRDQIALTVDVPPELPPVKCRSQQIQQVLMNLMTNARDALNERYPGSDPNKLVHVQVRLTEKAGRRWIRVTVEDHGTGIPPDVRERMFDPFFTTKPRDRGTGLGLAISHGIAKEHHGELNVESEVGRFTRMHLELPVDNGWSL